MTKSSYIKLNNFLPNYSLKRHERIWELDFLRGICILLVILDHLARLTVYYFGKVWYGNALVGDSIGAKVCRFFFEAQTSETRDIIRIFVLITFFTISGISSHFSKSNIFRALKFGLIATLISIVSLLIQLKFTQYEIYVEFGTIHFFAFCSFYYLIIDFISKKFHSIKYIVSILLFIGIIYTYHFYVAPKDTPTWLYFILPYRYPNGSYTRFYTYAQVSPGDLMNIIPWFAFFLLGVIIKPLLYPTNESLLPSLNKAWQKPISFIGKHTLIIYLTHVFIIGIILLIISKICFNTWAIF